MQEAVIYQALFSELTDAQFARIVGEEIARRQCIGVCFFIPAREPYGHGAFVSIAPSEYTEDKNAAQQLIMFATLAGLCKEKPANIWYDPGDDILSDKEQWK